MMDLRFYPKGVIFVTDYLYLKAIIYWLGACMIAKSSIINVKKCLIKEDELYD